MAALEFFESIADLQTHVDRLETRIAEARGSIGPSGQHLGSIGGGGNHDAMASVDALVDLESDLDRARADLHTALDYASDVLYGRSGRGGLAAAATTTDADLLHWRYCVGESWTAIGVRLNPESKTPSEWARKRAGRALRKVDRFGMAVLADS